MGAARPVQNMAAARAAVDEGGREHEATHRRSYIVVGEQRRRREAAVPLRGWLHTLNRMGDTLNRVRAEGDGR